MAFDKNNTSLGMKIIIIIFAVVLVLSLCLPFFSSCSTTTQSSDSSSSSDTATTVEEIQEQYSTLIDSLMSRLESNPESLTYLANLGNTYMDCAMDMSSATDASDNEELVSETFATAVSYYDSYLEIAADSDEASDDSVSAVTVDRAVCLFYTGEEDQAIADLVEFLEGTPDYVMGWYNLGAFYYQQGEYDLATEAYNQVIELDPDNETSAATYAQIYLSLIESIQAAEEEADADDEDAETTDDADADDDTDTDAEDAEDTEDTDDDTDAEDTEDAEDAEDTEDTDDGDSEE